MKTLTSLLERLNLDPEVLEACARNAEALGLPLERALYEAERINENQYLETAAARHAMPCELRLAALMDKEGSGWATDAERVCKVPLPWLRKQKVVPVRDKDGKLALAIPPPVRLASRTRAWDAARRTPRTARACPRRRHHGHLRQPDLRRVHPLGRERFGRARRFGQCDRRIRQTRWRTCWRTAARPRSSGWST